MRIFSNAAKIAFLVGVVAFVGLASGQWLHQGSSQDVDFYWDANSVKGYGRIKRVWQLQDRKSLEPPRSIRGLTEYDCEQDRYRTLRLDFFDSPMAKGKILATDKSPSEWEFVVPGSWLAHTLQLVCALPDR